MHVTWCSFLLSPPLFKGGIVIAFARLSVRPSVCMLCSIHLNHWTKSNKVWCARFSYEWGVRQHFFLAIPLGPRGGFKGQLSYLKSQLQKFFTPNFMFVLKNKRNGIFIMSPGSYYRGWDLGLLGGQNLKKIPKMVVWHIKLKGMVSRMEYKLSVHPMVKLVTLRYSQ